MHIRPLKNHDPTPPRNNRNALQHTCTSCLAGACGAPLRPSGGGDPRRGRRPGPRPPCRSSGSRSSVLHSLRSRSQRRLPTLTVTQHECSSIDFWIGVLVVAFQRCFGFRARFLADWFNWSCDAIFVVLMVFFWTNNTFFICFESFLVLFV